MQAYYDEEDVDVLEPGDRPRMVNRTQQEQMGMLQRANTSFVPAAQPGVRRYQFPAPPTQVIELPTRSEGERIIREETDPLRRSLSVVISSSLWGILSVLAGMVIIWASDANPGAILVTVLIAVVVTGRMFLKFDRQAHEYSPAGVDREKNTQLHQERMYELKRRFDLQEKMVDALLRQEDYDQLTYPSTGHR